VEAAAAAGSQHAEALGMHDVSMGCQGLLLNFKRPQKTMYPCSTATPWISKG
jgi:hypothetical protein